MTWTLSRALTAASCTPSRNGAPHAVLPRLLCDPMGTVKLIPLAVLHLLLRLAAATWPWVVPVGAFGLVTAIAVNRIAAKRRADAARRARWVEIASPAEVTSDGGVALWRLVAPRLADRQFALDRRVIGWELRASAAGTWVGLWVPPGISPQVIASAVSDAWPGAHTRIGAPGEASSVQRAAPVNAWRLCPTMPEWLPICAIDRDLGHRPQPPTADRLRVVYGALAACRAGGASMVVQVLVRAASRRRLRRAGRASRSLRGTGHNRGPLRGLVLGMLDFVSPGPTSTKQSRHQAPGTSGQADDPLAAARLRALTAKAAAGPHFEVSVRIAAESGTVEARRQLVSSVAAGFGMVAVDAPVPADLRAKRLRRPVLRLNERHAPYSQRFLASLPELAALAHLPTEPGRCGLEIATARRFPPPPEVLAA